MWFYFLKIKCHYVLHYDFVIKLLLRYLETDIFTKSNIFRGKILDGIIFPDKR